MQLWLGRWEKLHKQKYHCLGITVNQILMDKNKFCPALLSFLLCFTQEYVTLWVVNVVKMPLHVFKVNKIIILINISGYTCIIYCYCSKEKNEIPSSNWNGFPFQPCGLLDNLIAKWWFRHCFSKFALRFGAILVSIAHFSQSNLKSPALLYTFNNILNWHLWWTFIMHGNLPLHKRWRVVEWDSLRKKQEN